MKVIILSRYYNKGGAAIAAKRLFDAFNRKNTFQSEYITPQIIESNKIKYLFSKNLGFKYFEKIIFKLDNFIFILFRINKPLRSFNFFGLLNSKYLNNPKNNFDIINIHWINGGCISLSEISKIKKTIILTLHDSWLINDTSHFPTSINNLYEKDYNFLQKNILKKIDFYYRIYKRKHFNNIKCIIVPSKWLYDLLFEDSYFSKFPIYKIPNPLNLDVYKPIKMNYSFGYKFKIISYYENKSNLIKGGDLLFDLIHKFAKYDNIEFHIVGNTNNNELDLLNNVVTHGYISDEKILVELYNSVNLCLSTTRIDNLAQFLTQACACGLPIIAFNTGGNSDIVKDGKNGFLINNFDTSMIISKTLEIQKNNELYNLMKINSLKISETWESNLIAMQYEKIFKKYYNDQ